MNKLNKIFFNKGSSIAYAIITTIFTVVPEDCLNILKVSEKCSESMNILINRLIICIIIFLFTNMIHTCYRKKRTKVKIEGENFSVQIEYGDLFEVSCGKIVIDFDECFTTNVGLKPAEIKPTSVCGQYLIKYPITNMQKLINQTGVKPERGKSQYNDQPRYKPGIIVPNDHFLLMAFCKLDKNGLGFLSYEDYIDCLNTLWEQIDLYHGTEDVYLPILGSKITRFDKELTQQELLNIMIASYRLSPKKMKKPFILHIVCKEREGFSLDGIFGVE